MTLPESLSTIGHEGSKRVEENEFSGGLTYGTRSKRTNGANAGFVLEGGDLLQFISVDPMPAALICAGTVPPRRNVADVLERSGLGSQMVEIIDLDERPDLAAAADIVLTPALIRNERPTERLVGDLSATNEVAFLTA